MSEDKCPKCGVPIPKVCENCGGEWHESDGEEDIYECGSAFQHVWSTWSRTDECLLMTPLVSRIAELEALLREAVDMLAEVVDAGYAMAEVIRKSAEVLNDK